jgi:hypothetical protein
MAAEGDGLAERGDEDLAVGAGTQMMPQFLADGGGQLVVDVSGQLPEYVETTTGPMRVAMGRLAGAFPE